MSSVIIILIVYLGLLRMSSHTERPKMMKMFPLPALRLLLNFTPYFQLDISYCSFTISHSLFCINFNIIIIIITIYTQSDLDPNGKKRHGNNFLCYVDKMTNNRSFIIFCCVYKIFIFIHFSCTSSSML